MGCQVEGKESKERDKVGLDSGRDVTYGALIENFRAISGR